jgi:hypothetical protein
MHLISVVLAMVSSAHVLTPPSTAAQSALERDRCANATSHLEPVAFRGDPGKPQKLTELPDAQTYAAVYRVVNGCAVPVLYREVREVRPPKP